MTRAICINESITCYDCNKTYFTNNKRRINMHNKICDGLGLYTNGGEQFKGMRITGLSKHSTSGFSDIRSTNNNEMQVQTCTRCRVQLHIDHFHTNRNGILNKHCMDCLHKQEQARKKVSDRVDVSGPNSV
jgi:hypothetical protein